IRRNGGQKTVGSKKYELRSRNYSNFASRLIRRSYQDKTHAPTHVSPPDPDHQTFRDALEDNRSNRERGAVRRERNWGSGNKSGQVSADELTRRLLTRRSHFLAFSRASLVFLRGSGENSRAVLYCISAASRSARPLPSRLYRPCRSPQSLHSDLLRSLALDGRICLPDVEMSLARRAGDATVKNMKFFRQRFAAAPEGTAVLFF